MELFVWVSPLEGVVDFSSGARPAAAGAVVAVVAVAAAAAVEGAVVIADT